MNKLSVGIRNGAIGLKQFLVEAVLFFQQKKLDTVWSKYG